MGPMVGKTGGSYNGKRYRNYYCSNALRSRALCPVYNGHSAPRLEKAILEYLGTFSDPKLVREHLSAMDKKELERSEKELARVQKRLEEYESGFLTRLDDLLKRKVLNEEEFTKANETSRDKKAVMESREVELETLVSKERERTALADKLLKAVTGFLEAFESLDIRQQKAHLQTALKSASVYRDDRVELRSEIRNRLKLFFLGKIPTARCAFLE